jgi:hypothetical protein
MHSPVLLGITNRLLMLFCKGAAVAFGLRQSRFPLIRPQALNATVARSPSKCRYRCPTVTHICKTDVSSMPRRVYRFVANQKKWFAPLGATLY